METMSEIPKFKFLNKLSPSDTVIVQIHNDFIQSIGDILTVIIERDNEDRTASTETSDQ